MNLARREVSGNVEEEFCYSARSKGPAEDESRENELQTANVDKSFYL